MRNWASWWLCLWLAAAHRAAGAAPEPLFLDHAVGPPSERISAPMFALSDEMRRYLKTEMRRRRCASKGRSAASSRRCIDPASSSSSTTRR